MKQLTLDETHAALTEILSEFDRICKEHGLHYTLAYGTLLGAIRHKGFIPWDDDVDVSMPRPDYEKLYALLKSGEIVLRPHFVVAEDRGKKAEYPFLKLMDDRYTLKSRTHREVPNLYVDIFPLDGYPALPEKKRKAIHRKLVFLDFCIDMTRWYVVDAWWCYLLRVLCFWFYLPFFVYGRRRAVAKINKIAQSFPYETHEQCDCTGWGLTSDPMPRSAYDSFCEVEFEGRKFSAISTWHEQLTVRYGDYMTPPPPDKQKLTHCTKIYRNEIPD